MNRDGGVMRTLDLASSANAIEMGPEAGEPAGRRVESENHRCEFAATAHVSAEQRSHSPHSDRASQPRNNCSYTALKRRSFPLRFPLAFPPLTRARARLGSWYSACASATCNFPSLVCAR